jgi:hypothetical protein
VVRLVEVVEVEFWSANDCCAEIWEHLWPPQRKPRQQIRSQLQQQLLLMTAEAKHLDALEYRIRQAQLDPLLQGVLPPEDNYVQSALPSLCHKPGKDHLCCCV